MRHQSIVFSLAAMDDSLDVLGVLEELEADDHNNVNAHPIENQSGGVAVDEEVDDIMDLSNIEADPSEVKEKFVQYSGAHMRNAQNAKTMKKLQESVSTAERNLQEAASVNTVLTETHLPTPIGK